MVLFREGSQQMWQQLKSQLSQISKTFQLSPLPHTQHRKQSSYLNTIYFYQTSIYSLLSFYTLAILLNPFRQQGQYVEVFDHQNIQPKQNLCLHCNRPNGSSNYAKQTGQISSYNFPFFPLIVIVLVKSTGLLCCFLIDGVVNIYYSSRDWISWEIDSRQSVVQINYYGRYFFDLFDPVDNRSIL